MNGFFGFRLRGQRNVCFAGTVVAGCLAAMLIWRGWGTAPPRAPEELFAEARTALRQKKFDDAERLAAQVDRRHRLWASAVLVAGEAAARGGRLESAVGYYQSLPRDGSSPAIVASLAAGEVFRTIGRLSEAEREFTYVLAHEPRHAVSHRRMAFLYGVTGQRWKSVPHSMVVVRSGTANWEDLFFAGDVERHWDQGEYLRQCAKNAPEDELVRLGLAALAVGGGRMTEARRLLDEVIERAPQLVAAHAMFGELLLGEDDATFARWHAALPPAADEDPDIWFVRGERARSRNAPRVAARCFWETVKRAPNHRRGTYQLGQVLMALGEASGREFADHSAKLFELTATLTVVEKSHARNEAAVKRVVELMEEGGRLWEAWGWAAWWARTFSQADWAASGMARLAPLLSDQLPQTVDSANLALRFDLSAFPDHAELFSRTGRGLRSEEWRSSIHFEEATEAGVDFVYRNGDDPSTKGARFFESYGGGVAVIDFDGDAWPDLLFTQGGDWPSGTARPPLPARWTDRLYRNIEGQFFADVTRQSQLVDRGFGQGCAAGDFDCDGFPDLYVANIGRNVLQHNNGDGTFADVTDASGLDGETWTSSCAVVDFNADGFPDLYDVTYVTGPGVYEAICDGHACSPSRFEGLPDRLHLNRGDGTFESVPVAAADSKSSKGLGLVAVELCSRRRPDLLIANDQVPNFLLRNSASADRLNLLFEDEGLTRGVALNADGLAGASMGIAADDVDGDGRTDFFVTNFKGESKALYLQSEEGAFRDVANAAGLRAPGMSFVGWGTQFLDADCDGAPDLVEVNGHVDDYRDEGGEYHMRSQFFRNCGDGRFVELFAPAVGEFFARPLLGRGLARFDWNRDGRMDFVVSNIGSRASLVTNRSTGVGHFVSVRLHARTTARDAIGSVVEVVAAGRHWSKQLLAGDGYMASNERLLQFGLGNAGVVSLLQVCWPSGDTTTSHDLPVDVTVELVEGAAYGVLWHGSQPGPLQVTATKAAD